MPLVERLADVYRRDHPEVTFEFARGTNTGGAITGLGEGTIDLAVANRLLKDEEAAQAIAYHPFARDAVVFVVHLPNDVASLSTDQLVDIYGGSITDWSEVGGAVEPIIVLDRDEDESMRKLVLIAMLEGREVGARTVVLASAGEMVDTLATTPGAIGYASLALLRIRAVENVRILDLDGVTPEPATVRDGTYPWELTFGLVHRNDAPPEVAAFVEWVEGPGGAEVIESFDGVPAGD